MGEPTTIKIGPMTYQIQEVEGLHCDGRELVGHILYNPYEIRLDAGLSPQAKRVTLWHEILHGILTQAGYDDHDERMIEALSYGLIGVLQDNPWVV